MAELVGIVRRQIEEEKTCADSTQVLGKGGRGKTDKSPGSYRDISERTGIPESTIRAAEKHVAAIDNHPELKDLPKRTVIPVSPIRDANEGITISMISGARRGVTLPPLNRMACAGFK